MLNRPRIIKSKVKAISYYALYTKGKHNASCKSFKKAEWKKISETHFVSDYWCNKVEFTISLWVKQHRHRPITWLTVMAIPLLIHSSYLINHSHQQRVWHCESPTTFQLSWTISESGKYTIWGITSQAQRREWAAVFSERMTEGPTMQTKKHGWVNHTSGVHCVCSCAEHTFDHTSIQCIWDWTKRWTNKRRKRADGTSRSATCLY